MQCKQCGKPCLISMTGLRSFCSDECKKQYTKDRKALWIKEKRNVDTKTHTKGHVSKNVDIIPPGSNGKIRILGDKETCLRLLERCNILGHIWRARGSDIFCQVCKLHKVPAFSLREGV